MAKEKAPSALRVLAGELRQDEHDEDCPVREANTWLRALADDEGEDKTDG